MAAQHIIGDSLKAILAELHRGLKETYGDRLVRTVLYGSHARGDAGPWSDVDVLVVLKGPIRPSQEVSKTGGIVSDVSLNFDTVIQCLFIDEDRFLHGRSPLLQNISREGIEL